MLKDVLFQIMVHSDRDTIKRLLVNHDGLDVFKEMYLWKLKFELEKIPSTNYCIEVYDKYHQANTSINHLLSKHDGILMYFKHAMIIPYLPSQMIEKMIVDINDLSDKYDDNDGDKYDKILLPLELLKPLNIEYKNKCDCGGCLKQSLYFGPNDSGENVLSYEADIPDVIGRITILDIAIKSDIIDCKKLCVDLLFLYPDCNYN